MVAGAWISQLCWKGACRSAAAVRGGKCDSPCGGDREGEWELEFCLPPVQVVLPSR